VLILNKIFLLIVCFVLSSLVFGCGVADGGKVTARDVLKRNKDADIIQYDGFIFSNVTHLDWFENDKENITFSKEYLLGEIEKQTANSLWFVDMTASKLPKGTKVYAIEENGGGILLVEYKGEVLYYMQLLEG
jgi:hypothetical protein